VGSPTPKQATVPSDLTPHIIGHPMLKEVNVLSDEAVLPPPVHARVPSVFNAQRKLEAGSSPWLTEVKVPPEGGMGLVW
jgi:hypothetical protein